MSAIDYFRETVQNGVDYISSTELIDILNDTKAQLLAAAQRLADHLETLGVHLHKTSVSSILSHISSSSSSSSHPPPPPDLSMLHRIRIWCYSHRTGLGVVVCGSGFAVAALMIKHNALHAARKRRSKRFQQTGEKAEIVVVSGYEQDPIIRSIVLDLERRGFVVVVVVSHQQAIASVEREGKADLWPVVFDGSSSKNLLALLQTSVPNHPQVTYRFAGLVVSSTSRNSANLARSLESPNSASDVIHNDLLSNSVLIQDLLPKLLESNGHIVLLTHPTTHDLDFTPEMIAAQMVDDALGSLLRTVVRQHPSLCTTQLQLGYFDLESSKLISPVALTLFRPRRLGSTDRPWQRRVEPLRTLHNAVFDALSLNHPPRLWNVGSGSWMFSTLSMYLPSRVFERLVGLRFGKKEEEVVVESDSEKDWETVG